MVMDKIALALLIVGGLNWGCIGLFQFDLVAFACGLGQPDQPDHLYSCGPVGGVVYLAALPGHDGPARLTRQRSERISAEKLNQL